MCFRTKQNSRVGSLGKSFSQREVVVRLNAVSNEGSHRYLAVPDLCMTKETNSFLGTLTPEMASTKLRLYQDGAVITRVRVPLFLPGIHDYNLYATFLTKVRYNKLYSYLYLYSYAVDGRVNCIQIRIQKGYVTIICICIFICMQSMEESIA